MRTDHWWNALLFLVCPPLLRSVSVILPCILLLLLVPTELCISVAEDEMEFHNPVTFVFKDHFGPVYAVDSSPFHRNIFLSSSTDSTVRKYSFLEVRMHSPLKLQLAILHSVSSYLLHCSSVSLCRLNPFSVTLYCLCNILTSVSILESCAVLFLPVNPLYSMPHATRPILCWLWSREEGASTLLPGPSQDLCSLFWERKTEEF